MWVGIIMAAIAAASAIQKGVAANKARKAANAIKPIDPEYQTSEYAKSNLGLAQQLYNGRMAGATDQERNIQTNQSNIIGNVNRNATNSAQALSLAAATQGQTNDALNNLEMQEKQNKYAMLGNLTNANRELTLEGDKSYRDMLRKYDNDVQAKLALRQAAATNTAGMFQDLSSGVGAFAGSGLLGGTKLNASTPQTVGMPARATPDIAGAAGPAPMRSNTFDGQIPSQGVPSNNNPYQYPWMQGMYPRLDYPYQRR